MSSEASPLTTQVVVRAAMSSATPIFRRHTTAACRSPRHHHPRPARGPSFRTTLSPTRTSEALAVWAVVHRVQAEVRRWQTSGRRATPAPEGDWERAAKMHPLVAEVGA